MIEECSRHIKLEIANQEVSKLEEDHGRGDSRVRKEYTQEGTWKALVVYGVNLTWLFKAIDTENPWRSLNTELTLFNLLSKWLFLIYC